MDEEIEGMIMMDAKNPVHHDQEETYSNNTNISNATRQEVRNVEDSKITIKTEYDVAENCEKNSSCTANLESDEDELFRCEVCGKGFVKKSNLKRHQQIHSRTSESETCEESFSDKQSKHQQEKLQKCEICNKLLARRSMREHLRIHTGERPFTCEICGKGFIKKFHLQSHYRTHTGEKPYGCQICGKRFNVKRNLTLHNFTHTGEKSHMCEICGKSFSNTKVLHSHRKRHIETKGTDTYECKECGKRLSSKSGMDLHTKIHKGDKKHECNFCGKRFIERRALVLHERTHTGEKPYKCQYCGRCFSTKCNLIIHERQHTGDRPYKCDQCDKSYTKTSTLQKHQQMHAGIKPYKCDICGKCFNRRYTLDDHQRRHKGIRPFVCHICGKGFYNKSNLNTHFKTHQDVHAVEKNVSYDFEKQVESSQESSFPAVNKEEENDEDSREILSLQDTLISVTGNIGKDENSIVHDDAYVQNTVLSDFISSSANGTDLNVLNKHKQTHTSIKQSEEKDDFLLNRQMTGFQDNPICAFDRMQEKTIVKEKYNADEDKTMEFNKLTFVNDSETSSVAAEENFSCDNCGKCFIDEMMFTKHSDTCIIEKSTFEGKYDEHITKESCNISNECDVESKNSAVNVKKEKMCLPEEFHVIDGSMYGNSDEKEEYKDTSDNTQKNNEISPGINSETSIEENDLFCKICERKFSTKSFLKSHMRSHIGRKKKYECSVCGKLFQDTKDLICHFRIHTGEKPWQCKTCGKKFRWESGLKKHCQRKEGCNNESTESQEGDDKNINEEKLRHCDTCEQCFSNKKDFEIHLKTEGHIGDRPFKCSTCGKFFPRFDILTNHKIIHTGDKPYACQICGKRYPRKYTLKMHMKTHTDEKDTETPKVEKQFEKDDYGLSYGQMNSVQDDHSTNSINEHLIIKEENEMNGDDALEFDEFSPSRISEKETDHLAVRVKKEPISLPEEFHVLDGSMYGNTFAVKEEIDAAQEDTLRHHKVTPGVNSEACTKEKKFCCQTCVKCYPFNSQLKIHLQSHSEENPNICPHCGKVFANRSNLTRHCLIHIRKGTEGEDTVTQTPKEEKLWYCNTCEQCFSYKHEFEGHLKNEGHTADRPFKCLTCGKCFHRFSILTKHKKIHTRKRAKEFDTVTKIDGTECTEDFARIPKEEKLWHCDTCEQCYTNKNEFEVHLKNEGHTGEKPFKCLTCGKCFHRFDGFTNHKLTHTGDKPYTCHICGKRFPRKYSLDKHTKIHTGDKKHECRFCEKRFIEKRALVLHERTHTGEKPYKCQYCGRCFSTKCNLIIHERQHTGDRPYKCDQCDKSYTKTSTLQKHLETHAGIKPYNCDFCEKSFGRRGALNEHHRRHLGIRPFICDICGKGCFSKSNLRTHFKTHNDDGTGTFEKRFTNNKNTSNKERASKLRLHLADMC